MLYQVNALSPHHRFVIALHSPHEVAETGLRGCPPEKKAAKARSLSSADRFLQSGFGETIAELRRFSAIFPGLSPGEGVLLDIVLGVIGAVVGGYVFTVFGAHGVTGLNLYSILVAVVGAVLTLVAYHAIKGAGSVRV